MVETASQERRTPRRSIGRLVVREGDANAAEIRLDKPRTNIGRVVDVYRAEGLFRRNDLTFEAETEINRSVSREHAHIRSTVPPANTACSMTAGTPAASRLAAAAHGSSATA